MKPAPELGALSQVARWAEVDPGIAGGRDPIEHIECAGDVGIVDRDLERAVAAGCVGYGYGQRSTVGVPRMCDSTIAWHSAISRRPSRPSVRGLRPLTIASWSSSSSSLNASS